MEKPETVIAQVRQKLGRRGSWASISHEAAPWHRYITPVRPSSGMNTQPAWRAFGTIVTNARQAGWVFIPLLGLTGVMYLCHGAAAWLMLAPEPRRPSFCRTWAITVSGFSINYVTPMVNLGGEPYKAAVLAPWIGA